MTSSSGWDQSLIELKVANLDKCQNLVFWLQVADHLMWFQDLSISAGHILLFSKSVHSLRV